MQHPILKNRQFAMLSIAACALLACATGLYSSNLQAQTAPPAAAAAPEPKRGEAITLNFVNANIDAVARTMATLTGRNVVVDPRVKGTITLTTERPVSPAVAYSQFLSILRLQGFTVVNAVGLDKIVPEADAKLQGGAVSTNVPVSGGQIATTIFTLNFENANNLLPILRPLISPNNTINVNPGNNSLVITDYADNLKRLARIISALDVANATDAELIPVRYASVTDLAPLITRLIDNSAGGGGVAGAEASHRTTVIAEPRSNSLIVRAANGARLEQVKSLVKSMDTPTLNGPNGDAGNIYVVYLKNADSTKLAAVLRAALSGNSTSSAGGQPSPLSPGASAPANAGGAGAVIGANQSSAATAPVTPSAGPSTGGQIQADPASNSLIITASEPQYRQLRAVIEKLDARPAQIYVESLIAEVKMDRAAEFGIQWQGPLGSGNSMLGLIGTNFGSSGKNIIQSTLAGIAGTPLPPGTGFNLGVVARKNGVEFLGFLANFLQTTGAGNILSTPNLLTLDNEEAKIVIGQNVPFVTGQFTNTGGGNNGSVNPFQTIERKDVGLTLRVKPQISENGTVKMVIFQEVSSVDPASVNSPSGLITNKRTIETNVLVEDGAIIVLGGLLQDEFAGNEEKVPGLGDIPVFGNLFKTERRSRTKTNLMVFLRPVVVRDATASTNLSMNRYDLMRSNQQNAQPLKSTLVPVNEAPVLPAIGTTAPVMQAPKPPIPPMPPKPVFPRDPSVLDLGG
ncbi:MAG: type II secretion system secretin GspD [Polaromonas sp.]